MAGHWHRPTSTGTGSQRIWDDRRAGAGIDASCTPLYRTGVVGTASLSNDDGRVGRGANDRPTSSRNRSTEPHAVGVRLGLVPLRVRAGGILLLRLLDLAC